MPDTKRSLGDVLGDLSTLRKGSMPTGAKAAPRGGGSPADPVETRRTALAIRRNQGKLRDVNLPAPARSR